MRTRIAAIVTAMFTLATAAAAAKTYEDFMSPGRFDQTWDSMKWAKTEKAGDTVWTRRIYFERVYARFCTIVIKDDDLLVFKRHEGFHQLVLMDVVKWQIVSDASGQSAELISVDFGVWEDYQNACGVPEGMKLHFVPKEKRVQ